MRRRFTASDLADGPDLFWLLSITWAGNVYRWSSKPCEPIDADNEPRPYDGGLPEFTFSENFSLLSLSPDTRSISLELDFRVDVAALVQAGHDLVAATGEVALWRDGDAYEDRVRVLVGRVREPEYGVEGEPVALTLEQAPWDDAALFPELAARVTTQTWPNAHADALGLYYPQPFGEAGRFRDTDGTESDTSGSPGLVVEWDDGLEVALTVLVAGGEVGASTVKVRRADGQESVTSTVTHTTDALGRTVAVVDLSGEDPAFADDTEYWISWNDGAGALLLEDRSAAIFGAGDLLLWLLRKSSIAVDFQRFEAIREQLNAYKVSGYIDEAVNPWEWIADNLLPLLPLSLAAGPDGLYPILWRLDAQPIDAVGAITAGPGFIRAERVKYLRGPRDIVNEVRLSFAPRARTGEFRRVVACTPEPDLESADEFASHYAIISASRYGVQIETLETDVIYDTSTAGLIVERLVRAKALPIRAITYVAGIEHGWMEPGDVVLLSDDELSLDNQVCLVGDVTWVSEVCLELTYLVVEDPARDRRPQ